MIFNPKKIQYAVWQLEKGENTDYLHYQVYVELVRATRLTTIAKWYNHCHVEPVKINNGADKYCMKESTRVKGPWTFGEKKEQGARNDIVALANSIKAGNEPPPYALLKFPHGVKMLQEAFVKSLVTPFRNLTVSVFIGKSRTGKTRHCFEQYPDLYRVIYPHSNGSLWFDGYNGQQTILFDDFYGQIRISDMLHLLDPYPLTLQVKGSTTHACWTNVLFTSNEPPGLWYKGIPTEVSNAFLNRIGNVTQVVSYNTMRPLDDKTMWMFPIEVITEIFSEGRSDS